MITPASIMRISTRMYRYTLSGDIEPPFSIYMGGEKILETSEYTFDIEATSNTIPPHVEILDSTETTPFQLQFPAIVRIQWPGRIGVSSYRVTDGLGAFVASVTENGSGYYSFQAVALTPGAAATYTVTAYDQALASLGALTATSYIVAHAEPEAYEHTAINGVLTVGVSL